MQDYSNKFAHIAKHQDQVIMIGGKPHAVPLRIPTDGEYVVIDAINCVCSIDSFSNKQMIELGTTAKQLIGLDLDTEQLEQLNEMVIEMMACEFAYIFGDNFANLIPKNSGIHYYKHGYTIYSDEQEILLNVGIGGQNNTVFFSLTGMGCKIADTGWEQRLHHFLDNVAIDGKISRIDLAHDDLDGRYSSFDWANQKETDNAFMLPKTRNRPACTIAGEFKHGDPYNKGLTLYVGNRKNGKVIRCYEKGKQLGDPNSKWFRSELEIHAKKRLIPFDVLLNPTEFFCGAYPYCLELIEIAKKHVGDHTPQTVDKMPSIAKESKISLLRAIEILKSQFGKYIKTFGEIFTQTDSKGNQLPDYQAIFNKIKTDKDKDYHPKRLRLVSNYFGFHPKDNQAKQAIMEHDSQYFIATQQQLKQAKQDRQQNIVAKHYDEVLELFASSLKSKSSALAFGH